MPLRQARSRTLKEYLVEVAEAASAMARIVLPPLRLPLLLCLLGTLRLVLELADDEPERLMEMIESDAPISLLSLDDLPRLRASLASDGVELAPATDEALREDRAHAMRDPLVHAIQERALRELRDAAPRGRANRRSIALRARASSRLLRMSTRGRGRLRGEGASAHGGSAFLTGLDHSVRCVRDLKEEQSNKERSAEGDAAAAAATATTDAPRSLLARVGAWWNGVVGGGVGGGGGHPAAAATASDANGSRKLSGHI